MTLRAMVEVRVTPPCENCGRDDYETQRAHGRQRRFCSTACWNEFDANHGLRSSFLRNAHEMDAVQTAMALKLAEDGDRAASQRLAKAKINLHAETDGACMTLLKDPCEFGNCRHHLGDMATTGSKCSIIESWETIHTLEKIGDLLGITRERTRQIEMKGLIKIRRTRLHSMRAHRYG